MVEDAELLRRYTEEKSDAAFGELVHRHLGLVYSAAQRRLGGDSHAASDIAQQVFTALARQAASLSRRTVLAGWLYAATRNQTVDYIRTERRRRTREQDAHIMNELFSPAVPEVDWEQLRPVLDGAMDELGARDREAVLLRFFAGQPFAEIGAKLQLSEDAARMRVERALDKLHELLAHRGITSTAAALGAALTTQAVSAAPIGLTTTISGAVLGNSAASGGTTAVAKILAFMSTSNLSVSIAVVAAIVALGAAFYESRTERAAGAALAVSDQETLIAATRLRELTRRVEVTAKQTEALQQAFDAAHAAAEARAKPVAATAAPTSAVAAGRDFLAAHPEAQRLIDEARKGSFANSYGASLMAVGLTPAERDTIISEASKRMGGTLGVGGLQFLFGPDGDSPENLLLQRLRELLGEARFQQFEELQRLRAARSLAQTVAAATYDSDTPLTTAQAGAIIATLARHNRLAKSAPTSLNLTMIDWSAATRDLASLLSPSQMAAFDAARGNLTVAQVGRSSTVAPKSTGIAAPGP